MRETNLLLWNIRLTKKNIIRANMQLGYEIDARWDPVLYPGKPATPGLELES